MARPSKEQHLNCYAARREGQQEWKQNLRETDTETDKKRENGFIEE